MKKLATLLYGVICYVTFLATFMYLVGFLNNAFVPKGIDTGNESPIVLAVLINIGLIFLFGLQHTMMARPSFKTWWKRIVPASTERSTYVLMSSLIFILMFWQWRPITAVLWQFDTDVGIYTMYGLQILGWGIMLTSSFLINHFELFGLQQVYEHWRNKQLASPAFRLPWLYKLVRHPLMLGFLVAFWSMPVMTYGNLVFTLGFTVYIFVGIHFEERDLISKFGNDYQSYQRSTAMVVPIPKRDRHIYQ